MAQQKSKCCGSVVRSSVPAVETGDDKNPQRSSVGLLCAAHMLSILAEAEGSHCLGS